MKFAAALVFAGLLIFIGKHSFAEPWEYSCAEALTVLKGAQEEVTRNYNYWHQAKLDLRVSHKELEVCHPGRRGIRGGYVYCVRHGSGGRDGLKEVIKAEQSFQESMRVFEENLQVMNQICDSKLRR